jgi:uncharacterized protein (DUF1330 family)
MTTNAGRNRKQIPAYIIARVNVTDPGQYRKYLDAVPPIIEKYGGKALSRSINPFTLEGPKETRRIVLLEFPSAEKAKEFYNSPEYQKAKKLREGAAIGEMVVVEGMADGYREQ